MRRSIESLRVIAPGDIHNLTVLDNQLRIELIKAVVFGVHDGLGNGLDARDDQRLLTCFEGSCIEEIAIGEGHVLSQFKAYCTAFGIGAKVIVSGGDPAVGVLFGGQRVAAIFLEAAVDLDVDEFVLFDGLDALKRGETIMLPGFGTFLVRNRSERQGRNPLTGEAVIMAARRVPVFKPGKSLKESVSSFSSANMTNVDKMV